MVLVFVLSMLLALAIAVIYARIMEHSDNATQMFCYTENNKVNLDYCVELNVRSI